MEKARILIVEDEALIAEGLRELVEQLGHSVVAIVDTAEEAIKVARAAAPSLVFMDVRLKGKMDGIDAATLMSDQWAVPIVFMTAHSDTDTIARAMLTRPFGYVVKPVREEDLRTAIGIALGRHSDQEELRGRLDQYRTIMDSATDLVVRLLPYGRLLSSNPIARERLGYSAAEFSRLRLADMVAETDREAVEKAVWTVSEGGPDVEFLVTLETRDGKGFPVRGVLGRNADGKKGDDLWAIFSRLDPPTHMGALTQSLERLSKFMVVDQPIPNSGSVYMNQVALS